MINIRLIHNKLKNLYSHIFDFIDIITVDNNYVVILQHSNSECDVFINYEKNTYCLDVIFSKSNFDKLYKLKKSKIKDASKFFKEYTSLQIDKMYEDIDLFVNNNNNDLSSIQLMNIFVKKFEDIFTNLNIDVKKSKVCTEYIYYFEGNNKMTIVYNITDKLFSVSFDLNKYIKYSDIDKLCDDVVNNYKKQ